MFIYSAGQALRKILCVYPLISGAMILSVNYLKVLDKWQNGVDPDQMPHSAASDLGLHRPAPILRYRGSYICGHFM